MVTTAAAAACVVLAALAVFQVALALGAPIGRFAWGGQHEVLPTRLRIGSAVSVALYAAIGAILLARAGMITLGLSDRAVEIAAWVVTAYFALGILINAISRSRPERLVMTPTCAVLAALSAVVAAP
ncbi:hypothetical protein IDH50_06920 [Aeromicrobium tamlense]|uniref:Uncharacterized protein n=1 Tax=Aeromicrobium tamlense TaxID=375541 RepID=A0A8I0FTE2_9ACTN|nr:hypothetical protein [Aeromicrobium tamlense]MBD1269955.1 hypothetical protein [Aeromicrobium tamlense]NYI39388.1 hypothetical protein [Aeromicrobium tamlense]